MKTHEQVLSIVEELKKLYPDSLCFPALSQAL